MSTNKQPNEQKEASTQTTYWISKKDLPLSCPARDMRIWDAHPRVYLPIEATGEIICPYCSAHYILEKSSTKDE